LSSLQIRALNNTSQFDRFYDLGRLGDIMVTRTHGIRQGTRSILRKSKKDKSRLFINRIMHPYQEGDRVAIVLDGAQQGGMPHRRFQGKTGKIEGIQGRAYIVSVKDGNMHKTVVARPEHLRPIEG
jgi:large subunit ribosomal protein L21e|tara:strand:+ start:226 stop:603 length:378 start_codon:yes stop_codon:yes gene_type:complete